MLDTFNEEALLRTALDVREKEIRDARGRHNQWLTELGYETLSNLNNQICKKTTL